MPLRAQSGTDSLGGPRGADEPARIASLLAQMAEAEQEDPEAALAYGRQALRLLRAAPDPALEMEALESIGWIYARTNALDSAQVYAARLQERAAAAGDPAARARAAHLAGRVERERGNYDAALERVEGALAADLGAQRIQALLLDEAGSIHRRQGDYDRALAAHLRARAAWERLGDQAGLAQTLTYAGIIHDIVGNYDEALAAHLHALELAEALGDGERVASSLHNIGIVHQKLGNYDEALRFYERVLPVWEALGPGKSNQLASTLNNMGGVYDLLGHADDALASYQRALALWERLGNRYGMSIALHNIGSVHRLRGSQDEALTFLRRALALREALGNRHGISDTLGEISLAYLGQGHLDDALAAAQRAVDIAEATGSWSLLRDGYATLSAIYEAQDNPAEALAAFKHHKTAQDSLFNAESQRVVAELQTRYQTREQEQRIELLRREREIQNLWLGGLVGGLLLLALIAGLVYSRYRLKHAAHADLSRAHEDLQQAHRQLQAMQQQLIQSEKMASLGQLTAGIAHEIKNPLNFVTNFAALSKELVDELRETLTDGSAPDELLEVLEQNVTKIHEHGTRLDAIVRGMMAHARQGGGRREAVDLNALVDEYVDLAYHGKRARTPDFNADVTRDFDARVGPVEVMPQELGRVLINLLSNAFDAVHTRAAQAGASYQPAVSVATQRRNDRVEIRVADNGPGIPPELSEKIFEPFFTTKPTGAGTGLGLSLSYDIITQSHGGTLTVESTPGQGATFIIQLPTA